MSELRDDQHVGYLCFVCGAVIDGLSPAQTKDAPRPTGWDYDPAKSLKDNAIAYATLQNIEANEALILTHMEGQHSIAEVLLILGQARNALSEIREVAERSDWPAGEHLLAVVDRGLGLG